MSGNPSLSAVSDRPPQKARRPKDGVCGAQRGHRSGELRQLGSCLIPMNPGDLVVLAVAVVVTTLGSAEFVAVTDHRHTVGQQERSEMSVAENPSSGQ